MTFATATINAANTRHENRAAGFPLRDAIFRRRAARRDYAVSRPFGRCTPLIFEVA